MLSELPKDHPDRNRPLANAWYKNGDTSWAQVTPAYGIAKKTYNDLGPVWTDNHQWEFRNE